MPKKEQAPVEMRVLMDCEIGKKDDVISVEDTELAFAYESYGWADSHPDAVSYAKSLVTGQPADEPLA